MPLSPIKRRERLERQPLPSATPPRRVDMHDISNLTITGNSLTEPQRQHKPAPQLHTHPTNDTHQSDDPPPHNSTSNLSSPRRPPTTHPSSPRSTRSSRLRRQQSLLSRPESAAVTASPSASLQQLGAVHQQLQAMLISKADEHRNHVDHTQAPAEAAAATPLTTGQPDSTSSCSPPTSPLLQRLMALVKEVESQQQQQQPAVTHRPPVAPQHTPIIDNPLNTATQHNIPPTPALVSVIAGAHMTPQPLAPSHSQPSSAPSALSFSASPIAVASLPATASDTATSHIQVSQSHLDQQLRQLSEYKQQAVAQCEAVHSRLQAAMARLQSMQAQCSDDVVRIEEEYVRAVELCTAQHTQRIQGAHR